MRETWVHWLHKLPALAWLTAVWVLLWGTFSWANLLSGLLVALFVTTLLPLPPVVLGARPRIRGIAVFLAHFWADLVTASALVAWQAVKRHPPQQNAIVSVQLRNQSDLVTTIVCETLALVPGSLVLEVARPTRTIYCHVWGTKDETHVDRFRDNVLKLESRVIAAIGTPQGTPQ